MFVTADQRTRTLHAGAEMRPRRWYTDERGPPQRAARITSELWRYRTLAQSRMNNAAPTLERRLYLLFFLYVQPHAQPGEQLLCQRPAALLYQRPFFARFRYALQQLTIWRRKFDIGQQQRIAAPRY
jgi:hypothetical protein